MRPKPLSRNDVEKAMRHTRSNRAAARYLNCSYQHYRKYASIYIDKESGRSLLEIHKNQSGKGIPKFLGGKKDYALDDILSGKLNPSSVSPHKIKDKLILENRIAEECHCCGFNERRVLDYKIPLLLSFKDGNKLNYKLENLELLCYNCFFLRIGDVYNPEQIDKLENNFTERYKVDKINMDISERELSDELRENMKALGIL